MAEKTFQLGVELSTSDPLAGLKKLQAELDNTARKASSVGKGSGGGFASLTGQVKNLTGAFAGLGAIIGGISFAAIANGTVTAITKFETLSTVLTTITGSASNAATAMANLQAVAKATPFSVQQLGESFIKLKSAGIEPTNKLLTLFSDVASVTTDKVGALQAITDLYARTTAGGLGLEELNRLADRGIPVFDMLSKRLGVNRLQLSELGKSAEGAKIIIQSLEQSFSTAFGGSSAAQLNTLGGQFETLKKNLNDLALTVGNGGVADGLKELVKSLNEVITTSGSGAQTVGQVLGSTLKGLASTIKFLNDNLALTGTIIASLFFKFSGLAPAAAALGTAVSTAGASLATFTTGIGRVLASFGALTVGLTRGRAIWVVLTETLSVLGTILAGLFTGSLGAASLGVKALSKAVLALLGPVGAAIAAITTAITVIGYLKDITVSSGKDTATVGELFVYYWGKAGEVLSTVWDYMKKIGSAAGDLAGKVVPDWVKNLAGKAVDFFTPTTAIQNISQAKTDKADTDRENAKFERQAKAQEESNKASNDAAARALDLATGRSNAISQIVNQLKQETSLIGLNKQEAEAQSKILEVQSGIRQKLISAGKTEAEAEAQSKLSAAEAGRIRSAVAVKYTAELKNQIKLLNESGTFEISLLGKSSNEIEKQIKLREILVNLGKQNTATEKERADILAQITRTQDAQINSKLTDSFTALREETEMLKLGNTEREKRIALDQAAQDAGFKNRADLLLNATPEQRKKFESIGSQLDTKNQETINAAGRKSIEQLKEEYALLQIVDDKERDRARNQLDIYKSIDPEGKGKNITDAQKAEIELLNQQIEAQNQLIKVNEQIKDSFTSLGDSVTQWALGADGGIEKVRLALVKLAALAIWKSAFGGQSSGAGGAFFQGLVGGLRATGGPTEPGKVYRVGEQGPENVIFGSAATVIPNQEANMKVSTKTGNLVVQVNPSFSNHGTINSTEDLDGYMTTWGEGIANRTEQFVREQFGQTGLAYR